MHIYNDVYTDVYTHHIHIMYCENAWHCAMNAQNRRLDPVNSVFTVLRMHGTGYGIDSIQLIPYSFL